MMPIDAFADVDTWVFDLDHTLYPADNRLFDLIGVRMQAAVMQTLNVDAAEADRLRLYFWDKYGMTLTGLMREHDIDPAPFLEEVHDIPLTSITPDPILAAHIQTLPGRRIIYTNGTADYAGRVLAARGLSGLFDAIYGVEHAAYLPKPDPAAYEKIFAQDGLDPTRAAMFEDSPRNLIAPHAMGMRTVLVAPMRLDAAHIHHHTNDLNGFLSRLSD